MQRALTYARPLSSGELCGEALAQLIHVDCCHPFAHVAYVLPVQLCACLLGGLQEERLFCAAPADKHDIERCFAEPLLPGAVGLLFVCLFPLVRE